jgi:hypothetical protein
MAVEPWATNAAGRAGWNLTHPSTVSTLRHPMNTNFAQAPHHHHHHVM